MRATFMKTVGDGACGIHAVLGQTVDGYLRHPNPRRWIFETLQGFPSLSSLQAYVHMHLPTQDVIVNDSIRNIIVVELLRPFLCGDPADYNPEAHIFGEILERREYIIGVCIPTSSVDAVLQKAWLLAKDCIRIGHRCR